MGILSGLAILDNINKGLISIDPFDLRRINQSSVDLTLGSGVAVYKDVTDCDAPGWSPVPFDGTGLRPNIYGELDTKRPAEVVRWTMDPDLGWVLLPGVGYLMHTAERITSSVFNPVLDGKSSLGRLFIKVHETAGYGEPGFDGQYTLEVTSRFPVRVYPGMRFCQIRFHTIEGEIENYSKRGQYRGDLATGAIPSQIHKTGFS